MEHPPPAKRPNVIEPGRAASMTVMSDPARQLVGMSTNNNNEPNETALFRAPASWTSLTPELFGRIAPYVPIGNDLVSLCTVGGRENAAAMRHFYLRDNDDFLLHCFAMGSKQGTLRKAKMLNWMEVNTKWKKRCGKRIEYKRLNLNPSQLPEQLSALNLGTTHKGLVTFQNYGGASQNGGDLPQAGDTLVEMDMAFGELGGSFDEMRGIYMIGGTTVDNMHRLLLSLEDVASTFSLKFTGDVNFILNDPLIAVSLGLPSLLDRMVETQSINNEHDYTSILREAATCSPDESCFKFLLSLPGIDCSTDYAVGTHTRKLIHILSGAREFITVTTLKVLLEQSSVDVNSLDSRGRTALHRLCMGKLSYSVGLQGVIPPTPYSDKIAKLTMLLENGADPLIGFRNNLPIDTLYATTPPEEHNDPQFKDMARLLLQGKRNV